jgi:hypothetical protein
MNAQYEWLQELLKEARFQPTCTGDLQPAVQLVDHFEEYVLSLNTLPLITASVDRACSTIRMLCENHSHPRDGGEPVSLTEEMGWEQVLGHTEPGVYLDYSMSFTWRKMNDKMSCDFSCETIFKAFLDSEDCELNVSSTIRSFMHPLLTHSAGVKDHHLMGSGEIKTECGTARYAARG